MTLNPASSKGAAAASGAVTLLSTTVNVGTAVFNVTGLSQLYNDLIIVGIMRSDVAGAEDDFAIIQFNGVVAASYSDVGFRRENTTNTGSTTANESTPIAAFTPGALATASRFASMEFVIPGYSNASRLKSMIGMNGQFTTSHAIIMIGEVQFDSANAITAVKIFPSNGTGWVAGSELRIYGRL